MKRLMSIFGALLVAAIEMGNILLIKMVLFFIFILSFTLMAIKKIYLHIKKYINYLLMACIRWLAAFRRPRVQKKYLNKTELETFEIENIQYYAHQGRTFNDSNEDSSTVTSGLLSALENLHIHNKKDAEFYAEMQARQERTYKWIFDLLILHHGCNHCENGQVCDMCLRCTCQSPWYHDY